VGERLKPAVLKTVRPQKGLVGSNPTPSATKYRALFQLQMAVNPSGEHRHYPNSSQYGGFHVDQEELNPDVNPNSLDV
jgi:hypothetical protein